MNIIKQHRILMLLLMLVTTLSYGQHTYLFRYKATFNSSVTSTPLFFENTITTNAGALLDVSFTRGQVPTIDEFRIVTFTNEITSVTSTGRYSPGFIGGGGLGGGGGPSCNNITNNTNTLAFNDCLGAQLISGTFGPFQCLTRNIQFFELRKIEDIRVVNNFSNTNNEIKACESKSIVIPVQCAYALEYKIPSNSNWLELLPYGNNPRTVSISYTDFPGLVPGQNLQIRVKYVLGTTDPKAYSGTLSYLIRACSPQFVEANPRSTKCSYTTDGSFELKLQRNLFSNEKLAVTIYERNTITGDFDIIPTGGQNLNITSLTNNGDGTYSYFWLNNLPAKRFKIKYQTASVSENITDASFRTLEFAGEVTIGTPQVVSFSIAKAEDKTCFSTNNGYIDISASGQSGRTFFYQYRKDGQVQVISGKSWIPFSNPNTTKISSLGEYTYRIQVRDSNDCYAR